MFIYCIGTITGQRPKGRKKVKTLFTTDDLVRYDNGSVNMDGTADVFSDRIANYIAEVELEGAQIASAVHMVFDRYRGSKMNVPFIIRQALTHLNETPENSKTLSDRVHVYIQENSDRSEKKDKDGNVIQVAEPKRTRAFNIGKGKGSSVQRWSDVPVTDDE